MRIAIATVFRNSNYGAVLQAYALAKVIKDITNSECYFIDYRREKVINLFRVSLFDKDIDGNRKITINSIKRTIRQFINPLGTIVRFNRFEKFRKKFFNITEETFYKSNDINLEDTSLLVLGSDQIWNPEITQGFDNVYFGKIGNSDIFTISYAASLGKTKFNEEEKKELKELLKYVDIISVREEEGAEILCNLTNKKITCVPDPTILIDREEWLKLAKQIRKKDKYVMIYMLKHDEVVLNLAKKIAEFYNHKIVLFGNGSLKKYKGMREKKHYDPTVFLGFMEKADYIVTNSFHGTVFSVIFNKKFYTVPFGEKGSRIVNFCRKVDLEDRIVYDSEDIYNKNIQEDIDYESVNLKVEELKKIGKDFLYGSLEIAL